MAKLRMALSLLVGGCFMPLCLLLFRPSCAHEDAWILLTEQVTKNRLQSQEQVAGIGKVEAEIVAEPEVLPPPGEPTHAEQITHEITAEVAQTESVINFDNHADKQINVGEKTESTRNTEGDGGQEDALTLDDTRVVVEVAASEQLGEHVSVPVCKPADVDATIVADPIIAINPDDIKAVTNIVEAKKPSENAAHESVMRTGQDEARVAPLNSQRILPPSPRPRPTHVTTLSQGAHKQPRHSPRRKTRQTTTRALGGSRALAPVPIGCYYCPVPGPDYMKRNTLFLADTATHGALVLSTDLLCSSGGCTGNFAAIGGVGSDIDGADIRVYSVAAPGSLAKIAQASHGNTVTSVAWTCLQGTPILAIGGLPARDETGTSYVEVRIYSLTSNGDNSWSLNLLTSFSHGATIWSVDWLSSSCTTTTVQTAEDYLVIGGNTAPDAKEARLLKFSYDGQSGSLTSVSSVAVGASVRSVSACSRISVYNRPVVALGGELAPTGVAGNSANVRVFTVDCNAPGLVPLDMVQAGTGTVYSVAWCCPRCDCTTPYLAVGGDTDSQGNNTHVYSIDTTTASLLPLTDTGDGNVVFALAWNPNCCQNLAIGTACGTPGSADLFITQALLSEAPPSLQLVTSTVRDDFVLSISWCMIGNISYILVASGRTATPNDNCFGGAINTNEISLYTANFSEVPVVTALASITLR